MMYGILVKNKNVHCIGVDRVIKLLKEASVEYQKEERLNFDKVSIFRNQDGYGWIGGSIEDIDEYLKKNIIELVA